MPKLITVCMWFRWIRNSIIVSTFSSLLYLLGKWVSVRTGQHDPRFGEGALLIWSLFMIAFGIGVIDVVFHTCGLVFMPLKIDKIRLKKLSIACAIYILFTLMAIYVGHKMGFG